MSFVVTFQGQFKPLNLPEVHGYDHIHHIYKTRRAQKLKDNKEFENEIKKQLDSKSNLNLSNYQKQNKEFHEQKNNVYARDIMSSPVHFLKLNDPISEAYNQFEKYHFHHIPILNEEQTLVGIVSDRDLLAHHGSRSEKLETIMKKEVITALDFARIEDIALIMLHHQVSALPIIDNKNQLIGIVTKVDLLNQLIHKSALLTRA